PLSEPTHSSWRPFRSAETCPPPQPVTTWRTPARGCPREHRRRTVARDRHRGGCGTDGGGGARREGDDPATGVEPGAPRIAAPPGSAAAGGDGRPTPAAERGGDGGAVPRHARDQRRHPAAGPGKLRTVGTDRLGVRCGRTRGVLREARIPAALRAHLPGPPARPPPP